MRFIALSAVLAVGCAAPVPAGLKTADVGPGPKVRFDIYAKPLPEIPLPNDYASRFDGSSPTQFRLNASIEEAPTQWEQQTRATLDGISGWGTLAPISVAFTETLDVADIARRHQAPADVADDAIYVFDVTETSPDFCKPVMLDLGQGHFPLVLDTQEYFPDEPHLTDQSLFFDQEEEDVNGNGIMDPGEDTDMDGVLDHPNSLHQPPMGPFDVMGFYERETNTLIARPLYPMREGTRYAVVLTTRLHNMSGDPVRSPFDAINHAAQTEDLKSVPQCLGNLGMSLDDVAFTWSFTTQSVTDDYRALREGMYGRGSLSWLADQFPPGVTSLQNVRDATSRTTNTNIVPGAQFRQFGSQIFSIYGGTQSDGTKQILDEAFSFVDFYASGGLTSPQFFPRYEADGATWLPLYTQVWDVNPAAGTAFTRGENVPFFLATPKNRTGPAPTVIYVHGHGGSMLDSLLVMGSFARFGLATIGIDAVSHGIGLDATTQQIVESLVQPYGLEPLVKALLIGRAADQNGDGIVDSGADYWTAYVGHTRDVVRQTAMDLMHLVHTLRSFDGKTTWAFDVNHDGKPDLAGDFDGDGKVDIGGDAPIYLAGASLGGIVTALVGGLEPEVDRMVPILPGGYLSEIGSRSSLGPVRNAMVLRMMGPLLLVHLDANGKPGLFQMLPDLIDIGEVQIASLPQLLTPGKIAVARNMTTGEWRCGRVQKSGHLRVAVPSDKGNVLQLEVYDEELQTQLHEGCVTDGHTPKQVFSTFQAATTFQAQPIAAGSPLVALGDGFGLRRGSPELRRMLMLAQIVLESADPANFAPFYEGHRTLTYGDGKTVATQSLMVPMTGDPGVPIAAGNALLRAAGHLDYVNVDPRYGVSQQQELINVGFTEGVERTHRYQNPQGVDVLMDVDVLEQVGQADDGFETPRLAPPMRLLRKSDALGGATVGALFPMMNPQGQHSFPVPDPAKPFDLGMLLINVFGNYLAHGDVPLDRCMMDSSCPWITPYTE